MKLEIVYTNSSNITSVIVVHIHSSIMFLEGLEAIMIHRCLLSFFSFEVFNLSLKGLLISNIYRAIIEIELRLT